MGFINAVAGSSRSALAAAPAAARHASRYARPARLTISSMAVLATPGTQRGFFGSSSSVAPSSAPTTSTPLPIPPPEAIAIPTSIETLDTLETLDALTPTTLGIIDTLSLNLLSSPLSAGTTIILLTFLVRGCVTFPVSVWQRRRAWRTREKVQPEMRRLNEVLAVDLAREMRRRRKGWDEYKAELKSQLAAHQLALHKKYNTHPLITLITPLVVHVPILVTLSLTIRGALDASPAVLEALGHAASTPIPIPNSDISLAGDVSPWMGQSFWWLPNLAEPDASVMLPIVGGVVAMINAEMAGRKAKKVEGNEGEVDGAKEEDASVKGRGAAAPSTAVAASAGRSGSVPPASLSVGPASRPRPAAPSRIPRQPPPLRPSSPSPSITPSIIPSPSPSSSSPSPPSRPFSSTLPTPSSSPAPKKTYKRAPAQYVSPTLAQARQKQRAERAESVAKSGHMTSITPEQELLKEKDKASLRQRFMTNVLRGAAVVFVPFAAQVPAALALYWTTSMVFTMAQNALLDKMDERRKALRPVTDGA